MKKQAGKILRWTARAAALVMVLSVICTLTAGAFAAGGLELSTEYPGRAVKAGETLSINLDFANGTDAGEKLDLSVTSIPEGWDWYFSGEGNRVSTVYIKTGMNGNLAAFNVTVPMDTPNGVYEIGILAKGERLSSALTLALTVDEESFGSSTLTTEYPKQEGSATTSFSFTATIQNNMPTTQSYSFSTDAPSGWTVAIKPASGSAQVAAIDVEANASSAVKITLTPPNNVKAGEYDVNVSAISGTETLRTALSVNISESYQMELTTADGKVSCDAVAKKPTAVTLLVKNTGNVAIENINLTSEVPTDWTAEFSESTISVLEAGASKEVTAYITPATTALTGDYVTAIFADAGETSVEADFRVSVKTETSWGVVGVLLLVLVAGGLWYVFRKFGRR